MKSHNSSLPLTPNGVTPHDWHAQGVLFPLIRAGSVSTIINHATMASFFFYSHLIMLDVTV
jgi:hypothetical protein